MSGDDGFGLPRTARLRTDRDFRAVYSKGARIRSRSFTCVGLARTRRPGDRTTHRVGLSVSKDHGRAVRRNKIKRMLREAFRLERPELPGTFDLVFIPRKQEGRYELDDLRGEIHAAVIELCRRHAARGSERIAGRSSGRRGGRPRRDLGDAP